MKERGILFSAPMVKALLAGTKTVTRRLVKTGPDLANRGRLRSCTDGVATFGDSMPDDPVPLTVRCPYGVPGDRLWVRETWSPWADAKTQEYLRDQGDADAYLPCVYKATVSCSTALDAGGDGRWHPAIHMPRWASRITLGVADVRVERLRDITEQDAIAEGVSEVGFPRETFASLWDGLNGNRAPWESNPWVWRVEFRRVS